LSTQIHTRIPDGLKAISDWYLECARHNEKALHCIASNTYATDPKHSSNNRASKGITKSFLGIIVVVNRVERENTQKQ